jgi:threonine dehydrogenase-like Zn-dependent dehydrogenase
MPQQVRAAVMVAPGKMEVRRFPYPEVGKDDLVVKVEICGVCGTDQHYWLGELGASYPIIPGHESIGTVDKIGEDAAKNFEVHGQVLSEGDRVTWSNSIPCGKCYGCRWLAWPKSSWCTSGETYGVDNCEDPRLKPWLYGGYAEYIAMKPRTWVYKVPDELPTDVAVLMDTLVSIRGVETNMSTVPVMREGFTQFDTVVVQGAGPVGVLAAFKAKVLGAGKIIMIGGPKERLKLAREFGVDETIDIGETKTDGERIGLVRDATEGIGADMVVECTGFPNAIPEGIDMVRVGGTYVLIGCWANRGTVGIDPSKIVTRELHIIGQRYASPQQHERDLKFLTKYAREYPFQKLITNRFSLDEAKDALELQNRFGGMKLAITP